MAVRRRTATCAGMRAGKRAVPEWKRRKGGDRMAAILVVLAAAAAIAVWIIGTANGFRRKEIRIEEERAGVEAALTKRYDMLTKLLDAAKGYLEHERGLFAQTVALRRGMSAQELADAERQMDVLSGRLMAVAERSPELRSSEAFLELQRGIRDAKEPLQAARRVYHAAVSDDNAAISVFLARLLAGSRRAAPFFAAEEAKREDVSIIF